MHGKTFVNCHGPCNQGRRLCPCPDACLREDDAAWVKFHRRMTRITAGALLVSITLTLYVLAL